MIADDFPAINERLAELTSLGHDFHPESAICRKCWVGKNSLAGQLRCQYVVE